MKTIYATIKDNGAIRRINVQIAATTVEEYKMLKAAGIGTYVLFEETFHRETYAKMHPKGPKRNYDWHTTALLRAMACGCLPAGFAGFGGFDYLRQIDPAGYAPSVPLRDVAWGGNGLIAADHDVFGAVDCLERAAGLWTRGGAGLAAALENGRLTAAAYHPARKREALAALWGTPPQPF